MECADGLNGHEFRAPYTHSVFSRHCKKVGRAHSRKPGDLIVKVGFQTRGSIDYYSFFSVVTPHINEISIFDAVLSKK